MFFRCIFGLLNRKEFHIERNGFPVGTPTPYDKTEPGYEILCDFKEKVIQTWNFCNLLVKKTAISLVEELFCAQIASCCYFILSPIKLMFIQSLSELTPPITNSNKDVLCPDCRLLETPYGFKINNDETNIFFIEHDIDKSQFCPLSDMCKEVEELYLTIKNTTKYRDNVTKFMNDNPSLYHWDQIHSAHKPDLKNITEWKSIISDKSHFLFHFVRLVIDHIEIHCLPPSLVISSPTHSHSPVLRASLSSITNSSSSPTHASSNYNFNASAVSSTSGGSNSTNNIVQWYNIPNYFLILRSILPAIQEAILGNYSIGFKYNTMISTNSHLTATRCALSLLNNHNILNTLMKITFEPCCIFSTSDIELCIFKYIYIF